MTTTLCKPSNDAVERYAHDGVLYPIELLSAAEVAQLRATFDALEDREGRDNCVISLHARHFDERFVWDLATDTRLLDWVEALAGPNILLLSTHFFCKYPGGEDGHFVAWHQDVAYWGLHPARALSAWIAIDDSDRENGCMEVIPSTHTGDELLNHGRAEKPNNLLASNQAIADQHLNVANAKPVELRAGQMSIHDGALAHASRPNTSKRRRCGLTARFITTDVQQVTPNNTGGQWKPILVRGEDTKMHFPVTPAPF